MLWVVDSDTGNALSSHFTLAGLEKNLRLLWCSGGGRMLIEVEGLEESERGTGGFGSTGKR